MRLAAKLSVTLVLGIVLVMAGYAWVQVSHEVVLHDADMNRAKRNGLAWLGVIESVWQIEGEPRARDLIRISGERAKLKDTTLDVIPLEPGPSTPPDLSPEDFRTLASGDIVRHVVTDAEGAEWLHAYASVRTAKGPIGLKVVEPLREQQTFIRMSHVGILGATVAVVLICALIAIALQVWLVGRPLERLRDKARRAGDGDFTHPLVVNQHDEIGELAREINAMCDRIAEANQRAAEEGAARVEALEQLRHTDRLAVVGQLAASVAHELGTPLNVVSARAELIASSASPAEAAHARIILEQADRMTGIIQGLLDFSRRRNQNMVPGNLQHAVVRTLDLVGPVATRRRIRIDCVATAPVLARFDQSQMQQVFANLVVNGVQAMPAGGVLRVGVTTRRACRPGNGAEGEYACVTIEDEGSGIAPADMPRVFEPFFTTKPAGEGTGLGLSVAHDIVAEHGGWIEVESEVGKGTRFSVFLPRPAESSKVAS